jgi:undecaprenyl-diphosphatase
VAARALSWAAGGKFLLALAAIGWAASRGQTEALRRAGNQALLVTATASLLPHSRKSVFNQTRSDRKTILGHVSGLAFSGKREDAFKLGHALHMGVHASAVPPGSRALLRAFSVGLSPTRVVVSPPSDVAVGFALGAAFEGFILPYTRFPVTAVREDEDADAWRQDK